MRRGVATRAAALQRKYVPRAGPSHCYFFIINRGFTHYTMYIDSWTPAMTRGMRVQRRRRRRRRRDRHRRRRGAQRLCWHRLAPRDAPTRDARARSDAYVSKSRQRSHVATARRLTYRRAATTDSLAVDAHAPKTVESFRTCAIFPRNTAPRARPWTPSSQEASA